MVLTYRVEYLHRWKVTRGSIKENTTTLHYSSVGFVFAIVVFEVPFFSLNWPYWILHLLGGFRRRLDAVALPS